MPKKLLLYPKSACLTSKAILILPLALIFILALCFLPGAALAADPAPEPNPAISVYLNNQKLSSSDTVPYFFNGRTMLPLRLIFEAMGAAVDWDDATQTVTASRNQTTIKLTIGSLNAWINQKNVNLDVAPFTSNYRTYVPLRFIGEAFGAAVNWNEISKRVDLNLADLGIERLPNLQFLANNKSLSWQTAPFRKQGQLHLPVLETLTKLEQVITADCFYRWRQEGKTIFVSFDGYNRELTLGSATATVNGKPQTFRGLMLEFEGNIYAPLSFFNEMINASYYLSDDKATLHMSVNRKKFKSPFLTKESAYLPNPVNIEGAFLSGSRILIFSDNPESISEIQMPQESAVLWDSGVISGKGIKEQRVFGYHCNLFSRPLHLAITVENTGDTSLRFRNARGLTRISDNTWACYDVGLPLAEGFLANMEINHIPYLPSLVEPGETIIFHKMILQEKDLVGFQYDIDISSLNSQEDCEFMIRVVASKNPLQNLAEIKIPLLGLDTRATHPRGNWPSSLIKATLPSYTAGSYQVAYNLSNGRTDNFYTVDSALPSEGKVIHNPGHFGANYNLTIPINNPTGEPQTIRIRLAPRGGVYEGAARTPKGVFCIPMLITYQDVVTLHDHIAPPGQSQVEIEIMHAGGSNLAVAINILTLDTDNQEEKVFQPIPMIPFDVR
ncbi:MAG: copper amine oxidase N-terminal domain-containing protein [Clostridiales bacterium]|nr:copper amine oxidase N-terminal domain-containing protein [Clostridiales bacterium]